MSEHTDCPAAPALNGPQAAPRERPILFSGPMVRAILAGRKTMTRRPVKPQPEPQEGIDWLTNIVGRPPAHVANRPMSSSGRVVVCPYGAPGDRLWVKERIERESGGGGLSRYVADGAPTVADAWPWKRPSLPSIHMPRGLRRITLEVTAVRAERLQAITEEGARAEGVDWAAPQYLEGDPDDDREDPREVGYPPAGASFARDNFRRLWEQINGRGAWDADPWVWVVSFRRTDRSTP